MMGEPMRACRPSGRLRSLLLPRHRSVAAGLAGSSLSMSEPWCGQLKNSMSPAFRGVADFLDREGFPQLLAGVLVKGDDGAVVTAHQADQRIPFDEWMSRVTPDRQLGVVLLGQIVGPVDLAGGGVQAPEMAHGAQR